MKLELLAIALFAVLPARNAHAGFLSKMVANLAKAVAPPAPTTSSLADVTPTVVIDGNLVPTELGTASQAFIKGWKTGADAVSLMFTKKTGAGFYKIDGTVTIDGQPADYLMTGNYAMVYDAGAGPKRVEIVTVTGEKAAFTIEPSKKRVKILSINGEKDNVALDLSKDVVVELEGTGFPDNSLVKVGLAINQVGIKSMYDVCIMRYASKITIPAAAFRNINIVPGGSALYSYKKSYLTVGVDTIAEATAVSGAFPSVQYTASYSDGKFVNVRTEPDLNTGLTAKGTDEPKDGDVAYDFFKPNAFRSRPTGQITKIGLLSFGITGATISEKSVIKEEAKDNKDGRQLSVTTTLTFPKQTDEAWNAVLEKMYPDLTAILQAQLGAPVLAVDAVTKTPSYKQIEKFSTPDRNTDDGFSKTYRSTKFLSVAPVTEGFGVNAANERIMKESGADALMTLTLDLQLAQDGEKAMLVPKLTCEISGKINGVATNTKYFTATVTGKGIASEDIGLRIQYSDKEKPKFFRPAGTMTAEKLDKLVRRSDLMNAFLRGLKEMKEKEKADPDYTTVWALQG